MPLVSKAQRRWMWSNKPEMAKKWEAETPNKPLPERVGKTKAQKSVSKLQRGMSGKPR